MYSEIKACRICGNEQLVDVLDLGEQALTGVFPAARTQPVTVGPLRLTKCVGERDECGLLQLRHSYDHHEMYGMNYGYRSGLNPSMVQHLREKVEKILKQVRLHDGALVVDIGSNDSTTLQAFPSQGCALVGVDPTGNKFRDYYPEHIHLVSDFFSASKIRNQFGYQKATVIMSFSMFYDLENPLLFMREIAQILDDDGVWVFEQSYMPTMLERNAYDTVCHEHIEYYALKQILWMAERSGLRIVDVELNDVNGGSFSVVAVPAASKRKQTPAVKALLEQEERSGLSTLTPYRAFEGRVKRCRDELLSFVDRAKRSGQRISALGASTKGNVLLQYCSIEESQIAKVGEVNADKFGCFTPGTLLPIVPQDEVLAENPDYLLILPWHFRSFFETNAKLARRKLIFPLPAVDVVQT